MLSYDELRLLRAFRGLNDNKQERLIGCLEDAVLAYSIFNAERKALYLRVLEASTYSFKESHHRDASTYEVIKFSKKKARRKRVVNSSAESGAKVIGYVGIRL